MKLTERMLLVVIMSSLVFLGCNRPDLVIIDSTGVPIAGARVVGASLSMNGQSTLSNQKGAAKIPWSVQGTKWVSIYKDGFNAVENIDVAQNKPIIVRLTKKPE